MTRQKKTPMRVVFRRDTYPTAGAYEVCAWMPWECGTYDPYDCTVYVHDGGHTTGNVGAMTQRSRLAKPAEYRGLKRELERIGYRVQVCERVNQARALAERRLQIAG